MNNNDKNICEKIVSGVRDILNIAANEVNISVLEGVVELSGFVDVLAEKQDVERIANETKGVKKVINDITLVLDREQSDKTIEFSVNELLQKDNLDTIGAKVIDSNVILSGNVNNQAERKFALREASKNFGVKNVINHIEITPKSNRVDIQNQLANEITQSTVNIANVTTEIHNGKIVLDGFVKNKKEIESLMNTAEAIEGVKKVVNHLEERPKVNF